MTAPIQRTLVMGDVTAVIYPNPKAHSSLQFYNNKKPSGGVLKIVKVGEVAHPHASHACSSFFTVFSPDGTLGASCYASPQGGVIVFSTATGATIHYLHAAHNRSVNQVAFSPCSKFLAACSADCTISMHSMPDGKLIEVVAFAGGSVGSLSFSPCGNFLAVGGGNRVVRGNGPEIVVHRINEAGFICGTPHVVPDAHAWTIRTLTWALDGRWMLTGSGDCTIGIWSAADPANKNHRIRSHKSKVEAAWFVWVDGLRRTCIVSCDFHGVAMIHTFDVDSEGSPSATLVHRFNAHDEKIGYSVSCDWASTGGPTSLICAGNDGRVVAFDLHSTGVKLDLDLGGNKLARHLVPSGVGIALEVSPFPGFGEYRKVSSDDTEHFPSHLAACMSWCGSVHLYSISRALPLGPEIDLGDEMHVKAMHYANGELLVADVFDRVVRFPVPEAAVDGGGCHHPAVEKVVDWAERCAELTLENEQLKARVRELEMKLQQH